MKSVTYFMLSATVWCAAVVASQAQTTIVAPRSAIATAVRAVSSATQSTARATTRKSGTESLPPDLTNAIHTMSFSRSTEALFDAVKAQESGGKLSESEKFRLALLLGDWAHIGQALKKLPSEDATRAYARLLDSLTTNSQSAAQFYQQSSSRSSSSSVTYDANGNPVAPNPSQAAARRGLFLSDDFYAVIDASPSDLGSSHLGDIASLVKMAIGNAGKQDFLARLQKGFKGIGGTSPSGKKLAAELLSGIGWMSDAGPYLPQERSEWDAADTLTLVLTMEYFTQRGVENKDERQLKRAAELCAFMMQSSRFGSNERGIFKQATDRFVKLLPALPPDDAEELIRENFLTQPVIMVDLILALGEVGSQAAKGSDLKQREQALTTPSVLLRVLQAKKSALPEAVNVLVVNWLHEAEQTARAGGRTQEQSMMDSDFFLYRAVNTTSRPKTLSPEVILAHAPSPGLTRRLNQGLAQRVNLTRLKVTLLNPSEVTLDTLKTYLKEHPGQERELCQDYLSAWVKKRMVQQEDPNIVRMRLLGYSIAKPPTQGIPLTRLRQNQNVNEFKTVLAALRGLSPEPLEPASIIQSFMSIHSGAEVYQLEDIEAIFGPPEKMNRAELMSLVNGMRAKLREQWRDAKVQQDAGSNRTETEVKDEVSRGYRTALALLKRGLKPDEADWKEFIVRGQMFFDASEYEFSRQIKLSDYVNLRDEAFASYKKASEIYAAKVPELARGQWTTESYQMWFFVMLGASDLSQLTRAAARSDPGLRLIGNAMRSLPGEASEAHLTKFGEMLGNVLGQVPANMKQKFLSAGLEVIGADHPSAKAANAALGNYKELIDEVQLRLTVDGPARVGHKAPFGAFVGLEHTRQLGRESGGFGKYLQNLQSQGRTIVFSANAGQKPINYRDEFSKNIHAALDETFEVVSITFQDAAARVIDLPREGWQETPLAYLVLRSKNAAVDRIPSVQLDMDFSDTAGQVVLPVRSQVQPIDSKDEQVDLRPCEELAVTFVMDQREWRKDGKVVLEVAAKGKGIIPAQPQLFDVAREGFDVDVTDNGLSVTEFVVDGKTPAARSDRSWQITYKRKGDLRGGVTLPFPALKAGLTATNVSYKHYQDADLVSVDASTALAGVKLRSSGSSMARNAVIGGGLVVLAVAAVILLRKRPRQTQAASGIAVPSQITPFSVVAFLRRIQREYADRLDEDTRVALGQEIRQIESAYFGRAAASDGAPNLEAVARKWSQTTG